jgi:hypothetical protein
MEHTKGAIGIATGHLGRYREFDTCVNSVVAPTGTEITWAMGINIASNYNAVIRDMLNGDFAWIWILGDDHAFDRMLLMRLLDRHVDIVVPLCLRRQMPFLPVFHTSAETGYKPAGWEVVQGKAGLIDITDTHTYGNAGMLIRRHVLTTMVDPWFEVGQINTELGSSDLYFCEKARQAGFRIHIDTDNRIGHIFHAVVWPDSDANNNYTPDIRMP